MAKIKCVGCGPLMRRARQEAGMTLQSAADRLFVDLSVLARYERGMAVDYSLLRAASALYRDPAVLAAAKREVLTDVG